MRVAKMLSGVSLAACCAALGVLVVGCGGEQHDAHEPKGSFTMEVVRARFPAKQAIARDTSLELVLRNAGAHTVPNAAVTLDSFDYTSTYPHLAENKKPVWIVNTGPGGIATKPPVQTEEVNPPGGGETAYVDTWALGPLAPGATTRFVWHVTPVKAGTYTVHYQVAAGLDGKSRAQLADGSPVKGAFVAQIAPRPPSTHVDPQTGKVVPGPNPVAQGPVGAVP